MKQSNFKPAHFTVPQNYVDKVQPKGVDVSSPQMEVDKDRGVYSINYMWNGNKASKRFGYRKVGYLPEDGEITATWRINDSISGYAIYVFALATISNSHNIPYSYRTTLYSAKWVNGRFTNFQEIDLGADPYISGKLTNDSGFVKNGRLWLFGSSYINGGLIILKADGGALNVELDTSISTYVPTTTIAIPPTNAVTTPTTGSVSYEVANVLTPLRKNAFIGGIDAKTINIPFNMCACPLQQYSIMLDSEMSVVQIINNAYVVNAESLSKFKIRIATNSVINLHKTNEQNEDDGREKIGNPSVTNIDGIIVRVKWHSDDIFNLDYEHFLIVDPSFKEAFPAIFENFDQLENLRGNQPIVITNWGNFKTRNYAVNGFPSSSGVTATFNDRTFTLYIVGEIGAGPFAASLVPAFKTNIVYLHYNWLPPTGIVGDSNIVVEYESTDVPAANPLLTKRKVCLFGHNNALNRAWVYGKNIAYVSAEATQDYEIDDEVHDSDEDFTYFPVDNFYKFGGEDSKIIGMKTISESKMMVLKEKSGSSPSMYFVSPVLVDSFVGQTNIVQERYQTAPSNTMTAGVNYPDSLANFNGDIVFFSSERQIVGLDIEGITGDSRRAAYSRSKYIDRELKNESGCSLYSFANYLICRTASGNGYVAHRSQYNPDTRQYEWWPIDIPEGTSNFFEDNDGTLFIFAGCNVFQLEGHTDIDRYFINTQSGNLGLANEEYIVTTDSIRNKVTSEEGWLFEFGGNGAYAIVGTAEEIFDFVGLDSERNVYLYRLKYEHNNLHEFFGNDTSLPVVIIDGQNQGTWLSYSFQESEETFIYLANKSTPITGTTVAVMLRGKYAVKAVDGVDGAFTLDDERFSGYITGGTSVSGEFSKETPITSVWISRPVPISKFSYEKTIKQVDVYNDTTEPAELYIGCITNKQLHTYQFAKIEEFDLGDIDWENTTFDKNRVPVIYHMKRFPRRQQYFSLVQMSDSLDNSLLSGMDITFTLNGIARNKK